MADNTINSYRDTYDDPFASQRKTNKTTNSDFNLVFTDKAEQNLEVDDFLNLMVMQMQNQDFMNPMDDSQMLVQMAQFATMQQMQELAAYSKSNYASSLIGKVVTASKFTVSGDTETQTGPVQKISLVNDEYVLTVNGQNYSLSQIMELKDGDSKLGFDATTYSLTKESSGSDWVELKWQTPTTDEELAEELTYTVYCAKDNGAMSTVEDIEKNGTVVGLRNRKDLNGEIINGLEPNATYYINVVVQDSQGNKTAYKSFAYRTEGAEE